jgi:hypothetical protein
VVVGRVVAGRVVVGRVGREAAGREAAVRALVVTPAPWVVTLEPPPVRSFAVLLRKTGMLRVTVDGVLRRAAGLAAGREAAVRALVVTPVSWAVALEPPPMRTFAVLLRLTGKMRVSFFCPVCSGTTCVWVCGRGGADRRIPPNVKSPQLDNPVEVSKGRCSDTDVSSGE